MPNKNYINGRNREYAIKKFLEQKGFVVVRSSGSHSPIDLIALSPTHIYLIQSKKGKLSLKKKLAIENSMPKTGYVYRTSIALDDDYRKWIGDL